MAMLRSRTAAGDDHWATAPIRCERSAIIWVPQVDVVLDMIGGDVLDRSAEVIRPGGPSSR